MNELGGINVKFGADLTGLTAGAASAKGQMSSFSSAASSAMSSVASAQQKASEAAKQLELAQAQAAVALQKAQEMAASGKATDEQLAVAEAQAALAAERVASAEINLANAQEKAEITAKGQAEAEDQVAASSKEAASSSDGFGFSLGGLIGKVVDFGSKIGMTIFGIQGLIQGAESLASGLLGPGIAAEETTSSLQVFTGSTKAAQQELEQLSAFAAHTPFDTQTIDDAALKLQGVGINAKEVIPDIQALGDGLDAMGRVSSADMAMIVDSFMKIQTQGHLTTDVMDSFALQGIDAWGVLEKQTGKTRDQLAAMISGGLYPANQAMHDLTTGIEASPLYKGQMANDSATMIGALSTLKSNFDQVLASFDSPILKGIEPIINSLGATFSSPGFKDFAGSVGQGIVDTLTQIGQMGKGLFGGIDIGNFSGIGDTVGGVFKTIQSDLKGFNTSGLKTDLSDIFDILGSGDQIVGTITGDLATFAGGILDAANKSGVVKDVLSSLKDILPDVQKFVSGLGDDLNQELLPPLESLIENVRKTVGNFATWLDKSGEAKGDLAALGTVVHDLAGFAGDLLGVVGWLVKDFNEGGVAGTALKFVLLGIGTALAIDKITTWGNAIASNILSAKDKATDFISTLGKIKDKAGDVLDFFKGKFAPESGKAIEDVGTKADDTASKVEGVGTKATDAESDISSAAKSEETSLENVGTQAETIAGEVESIGVDADVASGEVATASTDMETNIGSVGTAAETTAGEEDLIGSAATAASGTVAVAAGAMMTSLAPIVALIGNIQQFQAEANGPLPSQMSVGDNIKQGLLNGILPAGGVGEGYNALKHLTGWSGFASGGSNIPEGTYMVGENGPELMHVPGGSDIYNNAQSRQMFNSNSTPALQPPDVHVHVYFDSQEIQHTVMSGADARVRAKYGARSRA